MTYTFKISRRLARFRALAPLLVLSAVASCAPGSSKAGLEPPPGGLATLSVIPAVVTLNPSQTRTFQTSGTLSDGAPVSGFAVIWAATGGSITSDGQYAAGTTPGSYRVIGTEPVSGLADTSVVTISTSTIVGISLTPASVTLTPAQTRQFSVSASLSNGGTQANPSVTWDVTGGTITSGGVYTAGATRGGFRVIATTANGKADTSAVTIATVTALSVTPASVSVGAGFSQQFTAAATLSNGTTQSNPVVAWGATGGTISASGQYTAGATTGTFAVAATTPGGLTDTSVVTITPPPPVDTTLTHQPAGLSVLVNEPWNTRTPSGWSGPCSGGCASHVNVVADATAPRSPANVLQFTYQGVSGAGDGVGQIEKAWPGVKTLYLAFWFKHSSNWRSCDSGINKMVYFGNASPNDNIINFEGGSVTIFQQNGINDHGRMGTGAPAAKGQWHFFEMVATIDGRLAQWVDGQSNGDRNDLRWQSSSFTAVDVDPIWGGGCSGTPPAGQTLEIDHLYISGK